MRVSFVIAGVLALAGCADNAAPETASAVAAAPSSSLAGTRWLLEEFRSNDDATGVIRVAEPDSFTMALEPDGRSVLRLGCNRGTGRWTSDARSGFTLGPLAMTRAMCPPPALDQRLARDAESIRSYVIEGDRLFLNLAMDGGTYVGRRAP